MKFGNEARLIPRAVPQEKRPTERQASQRTERCMIPEASFSDPAGERSHSLLVSHRKVGRKKALHDRPLDKQMSLRARLSYASTASFVQRAAFEPILAA